MSPVVLAQHVTKLYGPRRAVTDVSFAVEPGEIVGLLGPNGSGKSTIFRMITGYLVPSAGRIEIAGYDQVTDSAAVRREIGYVPEDAPLYDHMRVDEFLRFMASLKGLRGRSLNRAVAAAAEQLDLTRVMTMPTGKLSRGFRQRVSIAQALLGKPKILVLDEPTSGLDPHQVIAVRDLVRSLAGRHTVLLASHVLSEIEKMTTRVMILLDGRLLTADALNIHGDILQLRLRAVGAEQEIRNALNAVTGIRGIAVARRETDESVARDAALDYVVEVDKRPLVAADIAAALVARNISILELSEAARDLERVFLDLTKRSNRDAA